MKKTLAVLAMLVYSALAFATNYNTSTTLSATTCVVNSGEPDCDITKTYAWASQSVSGTVTLYVVTSGNTTFTGTLSSDAYVYYYINGSLIATLATYTDTTWTNATLNASISTISNLSSVTVALEIAASTTTTSGSRNITPSAIYIVANGGGKRLIWWTMGSNRGFTEMDMYPWLFRTGGGHGLSVG